MIIKLNPLDTFFFRDGKPFTMGTETWADGIFPPPPSVLYGALRSLWLSEQEDGFSDDNIAKSESLEIKGIFLEIGDTLHLPAPLDIVQVKDSSDVQLLKPELQKAITSHKITNIALSSNDEIVEELDKNSLVRSYDFNSYLNNEIPPIVSDYMISESKIGIGRQFDTRTAEEGKLYRVDLQRFKSDDTKIVVEYDFNEKPFNNKKFARLGGEAKAASYTQSEGKVNIEHPLPEDFDNQTFRLCLVTPAIFENGWLPSWIDETTFEGTYNNIKLKLLSIASSRPLSTGGFGFNKITKRFEPKKMYRAVPSGTVYWFSFEGDAQTIIDTFHAHSISEINPKQGFGITYVGL